MKGRRGEKESRDKAWGRERQSLKEKMCRVNAASLEKEQPRAVTPHSHTLPIMGTIQTLSVFSPSLLPGGGKAGAAR